MEMDVRHVARLARLSLSEDEIPRLEREMARILDYVAELREVDTAGVEPTSHPVPVETAFREDEIGPHLDREDALRNAPEQDGEGFVVPRVVG